VRKISPPLGFDYRTVQLVASRYIDYVTRPTWSNESNDKKFNNEWLKYVLINVGQTKNAHESMARKYGASRPRERPSSRRENNKKYKMQIRFGWFRIIINSGFLWSQH